MQEQDKCFMKNNVADKNERKQSSQLRRIDVRRNGISKQLKTKTGTTDAQCFRIVDRQNDLKLSLQAENEETATNWVLYLIKLSEHYGEIG